MSNWTKGPDWLVVGALVQARWGPRSAVYRVAHVELRRGPKPLVTIEWLADLGGFAKGPVQKLSASWLYVYAGPIPLPVRVRRRGTGRLLDHAKR